MDTSLLTAVNASAITFLIPIDLVPKVLDAAEKGQLQIITRNHNDDKIIIKEEELPPPPDEISISSLPELPEEEAPIPEPEAPKPKTREITFIKANSVETISVDDVSTISTSGQTNTDFDKKLKNLLDTLN
ncbi:MAG: hypothetical protein GX568_06080 [Candidatus Gastranaerophilales bacterium]|nr:hypothetical protein [Candidatus Gastranaerophilales bacterium]